MIKQLAWNTFKKTGDINTFLELREVENLEQNINSDILKYEISNENLEEIKYGNNQNEGNNHSRK